MIDEWFVKFIHNNKLVYKMNLHKDKSGKRCADPECRQIDWMPINCKYCHKDVECWVRPVLFWALIYWQSSLLRGI
jgi:hypothetical protein